MFNVRTVEYTTDYCFIFESKEDRTYFTIEEEKETIDTSITLGRIAFIQFSMHPKRDFYKRTYMKAQTLLANVGGLIKGLFAISNIFSFLFTKELYFLELVSSLFILDDFELGMKNKQISFIKNT